MKKSTKLISAASALLMLLAAAGCSNGSSSSSKSDTGKTKITFWTAPNPPNLKYWKAMAKGFEKKNPNIEVDVSQMKESPTSEASIQSAIASKTAPTMSENITRSFAAQLSQSKAVVNFKDLPGYSAMVKKRDMTDTMKQWTFENNAQYVIPLGSSPMAVGWRKDILDEIGFKGTPKTYSDVYQIAKLLKAKDPDKTIFSSSMMADPTAWMRWLDFFPLYNAATDGNTFVNGNKLVAKKKATEEVLTFMNTLQKDKMVVTQEAKDPFETGSSVATLFSPANLPSWQERYPELQYNKTYIVTAPPVPDSQKNKENVWTFGNAKGVSIYAQATKAQQNAAMKFLKYSVEDTSNELQLLKVTNTIPSRDDAFTNKAFADFYNAHPEYKVFAKLVKYGAPSMDNAKYNDIQQSIGEEGWIPVLTGKKTSTQAWTDMTSKIKGELGNE